MCRHYRLHSSAGNLNTSDCYLVGLKAGQCKLTKVHKAATLMETLIHSLTMIAFVVDRYRQAKV